MNALPRSGDPAPLGPPRMEALPEALREAARQIATRLRGAGHQAWLVGGCVRDLTLGRTPKDVDMVTDAWPDTIEQLFPRTLAVGKAFGTVVVHVDMKRGQGREGARVDIEVTTFRAEGEYRDGRRPAELTYAPSAQIDALRRDFTCNALYLDPLGGTLLDPAGGLADLGRRVLRTVGDASQRFREDGLRLWRMARFQAELGLEPAPGLHEAARGERDSLRGVSPERVHAELLRVLQSARPEVGLEVIEDCELWPKGWSDWVANTSSAERRRRIRMLPRLSAETLPEGGLAALLGPEGLWSLEALPPEKLEPALAAHAWLHPARRELRAVQDLLQGMGELRATLSAARRSRRIRFARRQDARALLELALAPEPGREPGPEARLALAQLREWMDALAPDELHPAAWLSSADLIAAGLRPGPGFGALLEEAEDGQLDGRWANRAQARAWLREKADGA